jgi:hypothetical protein
MATEKWIAGSGQGLTWGNAFGGEIDSLPSGDSILSDVVVANGTALDIFADVSLVAGSTVTTVAPNYVGLYLYPLNEDGITYGDDVLAPGHAAAYVPPGTYWVGNIMLRAAATTYITGQVNRIILPPGSFSFVLYNGAGVNFPSVMTCKYRTYNRSVV